MEDLLRAGFDELGVPLERDALRRFRLYYDLLMERNRVINLTAITGEREVVLLHFLDCAALLRAAHLNNASVVDVGSGAGFPGLALKIAEPSIRLTLLDSLGKRVDFLSGTCQKLGFSDVSCLCLRAEESPAELRESFDFAVSRAVAPLNILCELCMPLVSQGGLFLAMKGKNASEELTEAQNAIAALGGGSSDIFFYRIPLSDITHAVVRVKKVSPTPAAYPRRFAKIQKSPL
ncbi:MAG: 16S rRNA (guanine(527)-N(7))-methyltransferase RsmG [Defluviitaleaceae bacterium]|nr:16S rRNA (guanine(527)-N(7))-methyltransferase RsmG [Defluviitaleaceae bacterium]